MKDFEELVKTVVNLLDDEGQDRLREMEDWIIKNEGTWVLAEGFINFLGKVLTDKAVPSESRIALMKLLAYGTGQDDIVLILHMDRKDHADMQHNCDHLEVQPKEEPIDSNPTVAPATRNCTILINENSFLIMNKESP